MAGSSARIQFVTGIHSMTPRTCAVIWIIWNVASAPMPPSATLMFVGSVMGTSKSYSTLFLSVGICRSVVKNWTGLTESGTSMASRVMSGTYPGRLVPVRVWPNSTLRAVSLSRYL